MDTSDPYITFDAQGYCNHCTSFLGILSEQQTEDGLAQKQLAQQVSRIKAAGKGRAYDCVLGVSGGIDSSYAAYLLKQLGVRTLLVHMDNGWNAEEAVMNIKHLAEKLEFDYESVVLDWNEFRDLQLSFLKASVIEAETPTDIAILGSLHRIAARYGVRCIISGGNLATEGILPGHWHYNAKDTRFLKTVQRRFGHRRLTHFPSFGYLQEAYYKFVKRIRIVYLLNYLDYDKAAAMALLQERLQWKYYGGKHHESRYTKFVQSYLLPVKFNIDYRKATFSSEICAGRLTRAEALEALKTPSFNPATIESDLDYVAKKFSITRSALDDIVAQPPKTYQDYPNDARKLTFLYNLYRRFFTVILCLGSGDMLISRCAPELLGG